MSTKLTLTLDALKQAVAGDAAAFRCRTRLQPAGDESSKVFPPTYSDGPYATEDRVIHVEEKVDGRTEKKVVRVPTVLLDSVQSQANRMELALLQGYREGKLKFPLIEVDFSGCVGDGTLANDLTDLVEINSLTVPHRIADAILRDSTIKDGDETKDQFSKSHYAKRWGAARAQNATALFELCPTALIFGMWGSPEKPGGLGAKFARALVSELWLSTSNLANDQAAGLIHLASKGLPVPSSEPRMADGQSIQTQKMFLRKTAALCYLRRTPRERMSSGKRTRNRSKEPRPRSIMAIFRRR